MILLISKVSPSFDEQLYVSYLQRLPFFERVKNQEFNLRIDRYGHLVCWLMLENALIEMGYSKIVEEIKLTNSKQLFIQNELYVDFAHSGKYAVCVVSDNGSVGVDVQHISYFKPEIFYGYVPCEERRLIDKLEINDAISACPRLLSAKNAVANAVGREKTVALSSIEINNSVAVCNGLRLGVRELPLERDYCLFVAYEKNENIKMIEQEFFEKRT